MSAVNQLNEVQVQYSLPASPGQETATLRVMKHKPNVRYQVSAETTLQEVMAALDASPTTPAVFIMDGQKVTGSLSRRTLTRLLTRPFYRELFFEKPITHIAAKIPGEPLALPEDTAVLDAIQLAMGRRAENRYEPLIVVEADGGRFHVDIHALLDKQSQVLAEMVSELHQQREATRSAEAERERLHQRLVSASRQAGMAEVATSVLHNVGNVLNSVNVSTSVITERVKQSRVDRFTKAVKLFEEHPDDLGSFLSNDEKGKHLPAYLIKLAEFMAAEQQAILDEMDSLARSIEHIAHIVASQKAYAKGHVARETFALSDLIADALRMHAASFERHGIQVEREFAALPEVESDRHLVMQVVVNLISNARAAARDSGRSEKRITVRVSGAEVDGEAMASIEVIDNGVGIEPENLEQIFQHGFTTKDEGSGLGLHNSALAARQLGGQLTAASEGANQGASFQLLLPMCPKTEEVTSP